MAKKQVKVALYGILPDNRGLAKTSDADEVAEFHGDSPEGSKAYFSVTHPDLGPVCITTPKGVYYEETTNPHGTLHKFNIEGIKVHVTFKKIVGKLIYWA